MPVPGHAVHQSLPAQASRRGTRSRNPPTMAPPRSHPSQRASAAVSWLVSRILGIAAHFLAGYVRLARGRPTSFRAVPVFGDEVVELLQVAVRDRGGGLAHAALQVGGVARPLGVDLVHSWAPTRRIGLEGRG